MGGRFNSLVIIPPSYHINIYDNVQELYVVYSGYIRQQYDYNYNWHTDIHFPGSVKPTVSHHCLGIAAAYWNTGSDVNMSTKKHFKYVSFPEPNQDDFDETITLRAN